MTERVRSFLSKLVDLDLPPALLAWAVYLNTLAPGVYGFDSAELATGAATLGIVHATGYPLYLMLGKLFTLLPLGGIAFRVNLLSALMAALTVWLVARLAHRLARARWAAWAAAAVLAFSYSFWEMAVVAEVYTLHTFLIALTLLILHRWLDTRRTGWLHLLALVYGLSLTNHVSGVLLAPALAWAILRNADRRELISRLPLLAALFGLGLTPYLYLPLRHAANPPLNYVADYYEVDLTTPGGLWWMISGAAYRFFAFGYDLRGYLSELTRFAYELWRNFTGLGLALGALGAWSMMKRGTTFGVAALLSFVAVVLFYAGYAVADKSTMFLPAYLIWALWTALGAVELEALIRDRLAGWRMHTLMKASFALSAALICALNWRWVDKSDEYGPEIFARQVFRSVEQDAVVMGPWSSAVILEYYKLVEGERPDVEVFNRSRFQVAEYHHHYVDGVDHAEAVELILAKERRMVELAMLDRPVYDLEYDPNLARDFVYQPAGRVFQLTERDS